MVVINVSWFVNHCVLFQSSGSRCSICSPLLRYAKLSSTSSASWNSTLLLTWVVFIFSSTLRHAKNHGTWFIGSVSSQIVVFKKKLVLTAEDEKRLSRTPTAKAWEDIVDTVERDGYDSIVRFKQDVLALIHQRVVHDKGLSAFFCSVEHDLTRGLIGTIKSTADTGDDLQDTA